MAIFNECEIGGTDFILDFFNCLIEYTNIGAGGIIGPVILFGCMFALFGMIKSQYEFSRAAASSMFAGVVAALLMVPLGWISSNAAYLTIALFIVALIFLHKNTED